MVEDMSNATISKTTGGSRQSDSVVRVNLSSDSQSNSGKPQNEMIMQSVDLQVHYGDFLAVRDVNLTIHKGEITALIGPSGCGKSTIIRCFNRMNDLIPTAKVGGKVFYKGIDLYGPEANAGEVRRRIGMVFQKPNPFPKSIYDNVAFGPRVNGKPTKAETDELVKFVEACSTLGRSKRSIEAVGVFVVWRSTAKIVHCSGLGREPRCFVDGRTVFSARPDRNCSH